MKRLLIVLLILTISSLCLGGCTSQTPPTTPDKVYVGSKNSNIYHYPHCEWAQKIKKENEVWFSSPQDAQDHGYRACKVCRPP